MIKNLLTILLILRAFQSWAYDVEVDGIYYNLNNDDSTATVTAKDRNSKYTGNIVIPEYITAKDRKYTVTKIDGFSGCSELLSVILPITTEEILYNAFHYCSSLTSITIPANVTKIGGNAFSSCPNLTDLYYNAKRAVIDTYTNSRSFDSYIKNIYIGDCVESIPSNFMQGNMRITDIKMSESVKNIGSYAFSGCQNLTSVLMGNNVTNIGKNAFDHCYKLSEINFSEKLSIIGEEAFYLTPLETINIPNSVTSIGKYAFYNCNKAETVTLGSGLVTIGTNAFSFCTNVTTMICKAAVPPTASNAFSSAMDINHCKVIVPKGSKELYSKADGWSNFLQIVEQNNEETFYDDTPDDPSLEKCSSPIIVIDGNILSFTCETEDASIHYMVTPKATQTGVIDIDTQLFINFAPKFEIVCYAIKEGYNKSAKVTKTIQGLKGDVNADGIISIADITSLTNLLLKK